MAIPMTRPQTPSPATIEDVLVKGDLSKLTEGQRTDYYVNLCKSIGLNPLTQPFEYLTLNGKLVLYAKRACADQLRKINGISLKIVSQDQSEGILTVHVSAKDNTGREDEDLGAVSFPETLKGDARANAILKAVTKAKRRVTLSISGLGFLDETEVADIPAAAKRPVAGPNVIEQAKVIEPPHDPETGEVRTVTATDAPLDYITFGQQLIANAKENPMRIDWLLNTDVIRKMEADAPKVYKRMITAVDKLRPQQPLPKDDPEGYLKWLTAQCAAINDPEELKRFEQTQGDAVADALPPDQQQARFIVTTRLKALEK